MPTSPSSASPQSSHRARRALCKRFALRRTAIETALDMAPSARLRQLLAKHLPARRRASRTEQSPKGVSDAWSIWRAPCTEPIFNQRAVTEPPELFGRLFDSHSLLHQQRTRQSLTRRIYKRPPVVEALVDIHVTSALQQGGASPLKALLNPAEKRYHEPQELRASSFVFDASSGATTNTAMELEGYRYNSVDGTEVVQARHRALTVSSLAPYKGWEALRDSTTRHWSRYRTVAQPTEVTRIAVRYINRLSLPFQGVPLGDYLRVIPAVGDSLPNRIGQFLLRLEIVNPGDPGTRLIITEGRELNPDDTRIFIVLDLDASKPVSFNPADSETLFRAIEDLHTLGNDAFENAITDKARKLFE